MRKGRLVFCAIGFAQVKPEAVTLCLSICDDAIIILSSDYLKGVIFVTVGFVFAAKSQSIVFVTVP